MSGKQKKAAFPFLSTEQMREKKEELRHEYQDAETKIMYAAPFLSLLRKHLAGRDRVLDLGSANGQMFNLLHDIGVTRTYGADIENFLSKGKPTEGFATFDFNRDRYPYEDGAFSTVTAIEVIEHLENPFHFVREVHRILEKDGIFFFSTPNPGHLFNKIGFALHEQFYRFMDGNDHITLLTKPIFRKGILPLFDVVEISYLYPEMPWRFLRHFRYPANRHFGRSAVHILRKK